MNDEPKKQIYSILSQIPGIKVYQIRPERIAVFPSVTFYVSNNTPSYCLDHTVGRKNIEITVDIWGKNSKETSALLIQVHDKLVEYDYLCVGNVDIIDPDGYSHLSVRFVY